MDWEQVVRFLRVEQWLGRSDGYGTGPNNYRFYYQPSFEQLQIIPWGADQTLVSTQTLPWEGEGRLIQFCLAIDSCTERFRTRLLEVVALVESMPLEEQLDDTLAVLSEDIAADPRAECSAEQHQQFVEQVRTTLRDWPATLRTMAQGL